MNEDLKPLLQDWPYDAGEIKVRKITGVDGKEKIQMRIDLGVLQMETRGRPDGQRPFGYESYYDYQLARLEQHTQDHGISEGFALSFEECSQLRQESLQYYYRYLSFFYLADYAGVYRDTERNLQLFDFVHTYAAEEEDRYLLEQYRPYVVMMNTRAKAYQRLNEQHAEEAVDIIIEGINRIKTFFENIGQSRLAEECNEMSLLRQMAEEILRTVPRDPVRDLREEMNAAVAREDYERAAALRDEIRSMEESARSS